MITPCAYVSDWTNNTLEQATIHQRLAEMGVDIVLNRGIVKIDQKCVISNCTYTDRTTEIPTEAVVLVTSRLMNDDVWRDLEGKQEQWADKGLKSVKVIGDAEAPGPIAWATYAGHRYARELDTTIEQDALPFRREITWRADA